MLSIRAWDRLEIGMIKVLALHAIYACMVQTKAFYNNNNQPKKATSDLGVA